MLNYSEQQEKELLQLIAEGDELAFRRVFSSYSHIILPFLVKLVKSVPVAEELTQEVFLKVWINRDRLPEILNLKAWLFRIAANHAYTWLRKMAVEQKALPKQKVHSADAEIDQLYDGKEIRQIIRRAVDTMPEQRRRIYQMSREGGLKPSEIAQELNLSVSTVKNTLTSAVQSIREFLERSGYTLLCILFFLKK